MGFRAEEIALEIVGEMPAILKKVKQRKLVDQLERAVTSIALNVSEGSQRKGKDRELHYSFAAGSARETRTALFIVEKWGYAGAAALAKVRGLLDQELAILWRLTHPKALEAE